MLQNSEARLRQPQKQTVGEPDAFVTMECTITALSDTQSFSFWQPALWSAQRLLPDIYYRQAGRQRAHQSLIEECHKRKPGEVLFLLLLRSPPCVYRSRVRRREKAVLFMEPMLCPVCRQPMVQWKVEPAYSQKKKIEYRREYYQCEKDDVWGRYEIPAGTMQEDDIQKPNTI